MAYYKLNHWLQEHLLIAQKAGRAGMDSSKHRGTSVVVPLTPHKPFSFSQHIPRALLAALRSFPCHIKALHAPHHISPHLWFCLWNTFRLGGRDVGLQTPSLFSHSWGTERKWVFTPWDAAAPPRVLFPFLTGLFFHLRIYFEVTQCKQTR